MIPEKINYKFFKKIAGIGGILFIFVILFVIFEIYVPINPFSHETITYTATKGLGDDQIAKDLEKIGIIRSEYFFRVYAIISLQHSNLQAGKYNLSPRMSAYQIVKKFTQGDVVKEKVTIPEGWDKNDIAKYLEQKGLCKKDNFLALV
jgi:UPF0755 protein